MAKLAPLARRLLDLYLNSRGKMSMFNIFNELIRMITRGAGQELRVGEQGLPGVGLCERACGCL